MKKSYNIVVILSLFSYNLCSQSWQWVRQAESISLDHFQDMCTDPLGNVYVIGQFGDNTLGTPPFMLFGEDTVFNNGVNQIFIAKYSSTGNVIWTKGIGGYNLSNPGNNNWESALQIIYDHITNSVIMTGILIGSYTFGDTTLYGSGTVFITKIDTSGSFQWVRAIYSSNFYTNSIATDSIGDIFICGHSNGQVLFDTIMIPAGGFVAKYSVIGQILWAKSLLTGAVFQRVIPYHGKIYALFGAQNATTVTIDTTIVTSTDVRDIFVAGFTYEGNLMWLKVISSRGLTTESGDMMIDQQGNFLAIGIFNTNIIWGTDSLVTQNASMFLIKFDKYGNLIWLKKASASNYVGGNNIVVSNAGNIYISGFFNGDANFGSQNISSSTNYDIYIAKYKAEGTCTQVIRLGPVNDNHITVDSSENLFIAGDFYGVLNIGNTSLTSMGLSDIFLAKHDPLLDSGIEKISQDNQLLIYANPNTGKCTITIPDDFMKEKNLTLKIYDNTGKQISNSTIEIGEDRIKLNLEARAKGMYQAVLTNGHKSYTGKIVFQ